jgi:hypothetical protein
MKNTSNMPFTQRGRHYPVPYPLYLTGICRRDSRIQSPCPRCGQAMPDCPGAVSLIDLETELCLDCGRWEAMSELTHELAEDWRKKKARLKSP